MRLAVKRSAFRVGLPLGLAICIAADARPFVSLVDFVVSLVMATALVTLPIVAVSAWTRRCRGSSAVQATLAFLAVVGTTLGASVATLWAASEVPHGLWNRLPDAPAGTIAFAGPTCTRDTGPGAFTVYVTTKQGRLFRLKVDSTPRRWLAVDSLMDSYGAGGCPAAQVGPRKPPMYWGRALATYRIADQGADCGGNRFYRLMADQSIWEWSTGGCALTAVFGFLLFLLLALLLGIYAFVMQGEAREDRLHRGKARAPPNGACS